MNSQSREFRWWHEVLLALLLLAIVVLGGMLLPRFFWSLTQQLRLSRQIWEVALLSLGMTLIILTAGIDLSVGSMMALSAVTFGMVFRSTESLWASGICCLAVGTSCGLLNGALIVRLKLHPLIVTLATFAAFRGVAEGISQGASYSGFGEAFGQLSHNDYWGVSLAGWCFAGLVVLLTAMLAKTSWGRFLYAIGHNESAVRFSGGPVDGIKLVLYSASGLLSALAAIVLVSRSSQRRRRLRV
jgi:rhamnose transport system permease protein